MDLPSPALLQNTRVFFEFGERCSAFESFGYILLLKGGDMHEKKKTKS